jgi:hypothetical protein
MGVRRGISRLGGLVLRQFFPCITIARMSVAGLLVGIHEDVVTTGRRVMQPWGDTEASRKGDESTRHVQGYLRMPELHFGGHRHPCMHAGFVCVTMACMCEELDFGLDNDMSTRRCCPTSKKVW